MRPCDYSTAPNVASPRISGNFVAVGPPLQVENRASRFVSRFVYVCSQLSATAASRCVSFHGRATCGQARLFFGGHTRSTGSCHTRLATENRRWTHLRAVPAVGGCGAALVEAAPSNRRTHRTPWRTGEQRVDCLPLFQTICCSTASSCAARSIHWVRSHARPSPAGCRFIPMRCGSRCVNPPLGP